MSDKRKLSGEEIREAVRIFRRGMDMIPDRAGEYPNAKALGDACVTVAAAAAKFGGEADFYVCSLRRRCRWWRAVGQTVAIEHGSREYNLHTAPGSKTSPGCRGTLEPLFTAPEVEDAN